MALPPIDRATGRELAALARLQLPMEREEAVLARLQRTLAALDDVASVDTTGVPPTTYPLPLPATLRPDAPGPVLTPAEALANAPAQAAGCFLVPRTVDG